MYKPYITIVFVFFSILISSLNSPLNNIVLLAEGQQQQQLQQSAISASTKNVTDLSKLNGKNSSITLENKTVDYFENANGYLVYPISTTTSSSIESNISANSNNTFPAVVMIHEWWGLNENIKNMAENLAKEGYVVLAVDLYNGQVANTTESAQNLVSKVRENPSESINNLQHAVRYLASLENVNSSKIASLGWCFGGGQSLQLALNTEPEYPLAATIIYYGNLVSDQESISKIKWPVLGIFGDQDKSISVESVKQFEEALNKNGITNEIYIYKGVGHAFANPSGDNYAPQETQDAWEKTVSFLKKYLK
ncbi:MAG: dienelactone hydrolase family protein [Nitrososphaeraceae archaeon]|nr:dienelactone hydrolase family protein [Nitrososphaeraceae archaeon]